jgi:glycosyltransferase involved in cell wall biosynthesis
MKKHRIAIVTVQSASGEVGGAERFYQGLETALNAAGTDADIISVTSNEADFDAIKESYLSFYDLDLSAYDGVISTKAPSYVVRHPNHICFLVHTMRVFYDLFEREFPEPWKELLDHRNLIHALDTGSLMPPRTKKVFCIGHEVHNRLLKYNGIDAEVLHMDLAFDEFRSGDFHYAFLPSRLHRWKRADLVIRAMKFVNRPVMLEIVGTGEQEAEFKQLAADDPRILFLGRVSDQELVQLYANALVVLFVPIREDLGFVTLEAFRSSKPVITCTDSGEPTYFVKNEISGFICPPDPKSIGEKIELLHDQPETAKRMGRNGRRSIEHLSWKSVSEKLLAALGL